MSSSYTLPEDIKAAYLKTDYSFTDGAQEIIIRLDESNSDLLDYLKLKQISNWAFITAWNPYSNAQTNEYNRGQQDELLHRLKGYKVCMGEGKGRDGLWPAEQSVFVAGISREDAKFLGSDFGQYAILVSSENGEPELLPCPPML
jgi:hypothetical protein